MKGVGLTLLALIALGGCVEEKKERTFRTAKIVRSDIRSTVEATGTVTPIKKVEVGAQVNGRIVKLLVDYNSVVTNGQVVALIDPQVYEAQYKSALAQLHGNEANVKLREATLALAEKTLERKRKLAEKGMCSQSDLDSAVETRDAGAAQLDSARAAVEQSRASVSQAQANLNYCTIVSPVNGVVIMRSVDEGQTVVSSMNAVPILTIAEDLKTVWVEASVPEADVGSIKVGQKVTFTADAYREHFTGVVRQVRLSATSANNVVTYPIIVEAENRGEKLFPGMTATLTIETACAENALVVTSAALRFRPEGVKTDIRGRKVWLLNNGELEPVKVELGIADTSFTQLIGLDELEGREVVIGYETPGLETNKKGQSNPFMPKMPSRNKTKGTAPEPRK